MRKWLDDLSAKTLHIEPGSHWESGYPDSANGKLRDEFLNVEIFDTLRWRPHSALRYRTPAPHALQPWALGFARLCLLPRAAEV